ncbi:MAG: alpha/beta hydrolase [Gemmatimonadetes bacterium]|nr:alpha/beta hydrolase [Gemmatimonadota bacterium]
MTIRTLARSVAAGVLALSSACGGTTPIPEPIVATIPAPLPRADRPRSYASLDSGSGRVTVFLATTRRFVSSDRPANRFTGDDADSLQFAVVGVNVPGYRARGTGELPRTSSIYSAFGAPPDPQRAFFVTNVVTTDSARFVQRLAGDIAATRSRNVLVFVHGFNVSFEDAAVRAAQIAADMNFDGSVVVFSWPSAASVTSYVRDLQTARNAGYHLLRLVRNIVPAAQPDHVHLLGHSMGSEVIGKAAALVTPADSAAKFAQVVLAAPDIDARVFRRELLPVLVAHSLRVTLYASSDDDALRASRSVNGVWRLGLGGDSLTVVRGMDTIDATRIRADALGHTLFGNSIFLADLAALIGDGRSPEERRLLSVQRGNLTFWRFRGDAR